MVTIEVNGVKIEAENWKAARRLVMKEEKRQDAKRKEDNHYQSLAKELGLEPMKFAA